MLDRFSQLAEQLADRAGDIARETYGATLEIGRKADKSVVTETDRRIETELSRLIEAEFPDHGIIGEEHGATRADAPYQWVIDPIDGTSAFIAHIPTFTTLIALCHEGKPILGIIDQPISKERWVSTKVVKLASSPTDLRQTILGTTSMAYFNDAEAKKFSALRRVIGASIHAGDAYLYAQIASGKIGVVVDSGLKNYDFCALVPVVEAAGGIITDWRGAPLTLHSDGKVLACANESLHKEAIRILND